MTKNQFKNKLKEKDLSQLEKVEICQFFLDNYPETTILQGFTKLDVNITGGSDEAVNRAFNGLVSNIDKF